MNDLVKAARDALDLIEKIDTGIYSTDEVVFNLRAAVERAENPPTDFDTWWAQTEIWPSEYTAAASAWIAAQQAERGRIKDLLRQSDDWFEDEQMEQAKWLLEKIDE